MLDFKDFLPMRSAPCRFPFLMWVKSCKKGEPGIYVVQRFFGEDRFYLCEEADTIGPVTIWKDVVGGWLPLPQEAFANTKEYSSFVKDVMEREITYFIDENEDYIFDGNMGDENFGEDLLWWHNGRVFGYRELKAACLNSIDEIKPWY